MVKRKFSSRSSKENTQLVDSVLHNFDDKECQQVRHDLLKWYQENKRDLPWRKYAQHPDLNIRAYSVWVSEVMLQQTQVATVIDYYNKWMKKWPTLQDLSEATLEEVNEMWSGLGYYSRGRRLFEGASKVVNELNGEMPKDADSLLKQLPGVGRYTAGAISSIAYNQQTGVVDGNVIRVLCRCRMIGAGSNNQVVMDTLWKLANTLVDPVQPGDFNQGLMELGATICTPKSPDCSQCPLKTNCKSYQRVQAEKLKSSERLIDSTIKNDDIVDIECLTDNCVLCLPDTEVYDSSLGVMNYPRKGKKKQAREESTLVCIICKKTENEDAFVITQRPEKGLLAGLWEFPSQTFDKDNTGDADSSTLLSNHGIKVTSELTKGSCGEVVHIFSHIHQTYVVEFITVNQSDVYFENQSKYKWVTKQQFYEAAVSTAMKKVFKQYESSMNGNKKDGKHTKLKSKTDNNQKSIQEFFKPKSKK
ncbi:hypothetical protein ACF0H5_004262 [Mactra antiquata]